MLQRNQPKSEQIESRTEYRFSYNKEQVDINRRISITVNNESINEILNKIFAGTNVQYTISGNQIILKYTAKPGKKKVNVKGRILDENNEPMPGVTILIENSSIGTVSDIDGYFAIAVPLGSSLKVSSIGFKNQYFHINKANELNNKRSEKEIEAKQKCFEASNIEDAKTL